MLRFGPGEGGIQSEYQNLEMMQVDAWEVLPWGIGQRMESRAQILETLRAAGAEYTLFLVGNR